jgi:hypothetical protein
LHVKIVKIMKSKWRNGEQGMTRLYMSIIVGIAMIVSAPVVAQTARELSARQVVMGLEADSIMPVATWRQPGPSTVRIQCNVSRSPNPGSQALFFNACTITLLSPEGATISEVTRPGRIGLHFMRPVAGTPTGPVTFTLRCVSEDSSRYCSMAR